MGAGPRRLRRALLAHAALLGVAAFAPAAALAALTVTPITWDVVGLDSNNVNVGPNTFPVGVRVCTDSNPATDVQATFVWTSSNPYIALRTGTASVLPVVGGSVDLAAGDCYDFYFEAEVTRNPGAYETTRSYRIDVVADGGATTAASPTPRQLFVERLISQSRNEDLNLLIRPTGVGSYTSVPAGGTFALLVGGVYDIRLLASTATNGYEQLETYINIPNVVFEILSVQSTYTAASGGGSLSEDRLYADSCDWQANPLSPAYRSCTAVGKAGGNIQVDYVVRILAPPGAPLVNPAPISTVVHDFSGSSYHYNADYSGTTRDLYIVDPSILGFGKAFNPSTTTAGGISTLTFTITNPAPAPISGLSFTDTFPTSPGAMVVATPATFSTSGCGTPTFSPTAGAGSVSFSNGTVGANSTCSVSVAVRVPVAGTYDNTSGPLLVQGTDTGSVATASLIATTAPPAPACVNGMVLATWTFNSGTATLPTPSYQSTAVSTATATYAGTGTATLDTTTGNPANSWGVTGGWPATNATFPNANPPHFQFALDTTNFSNVSITYHYKILGNWANANNNFLYTYSSSDGVNFSSLGTPVTNFTKNAVWVSAGTYAAATTGATTTTFRVNAVGQQQNDAQLLLDNVTFTGCGIPLPPRLTKAFSPSPVAVNGVSTLTFTIQNPNNDAALSGITFTDSLPAGLQVAATPAASTTCGGTPTWAPTAGATTLTFGSPAGATLPISGTCTAQVNVIATTAGPHVNVSGFVSATQSGPNNTTTGQATASLTAISPPSIAKSFSPNPIVAGANSVLTFTIVNPNPNDALSGVAFADTFPTSPGSMVVAPTPGASTSGCGSPTFSPTAGAGSVSFANGTIAAGGTCVVSVTVTAPAAGTYTNTTGAVSHVINAATVSGNTATATLLVEAPTPAVALLKQVGPSATGPWTSLLVLAVGDPVFYQFTIENTGDVTLSSIALSDPNVNVATCSPALPATLAPGDTATCVVNGGTAVAGTTQNTATASGTYLGSPVTDTSTAIYTTTGLALVKVAAESSFSAAGTTLNYTFAVSNVGAAPLAGPVTITDPLVPGYSCPPLGDGILDPGETTLCTGSYLTTSGDVPGGVSNTATATAGGTNSNPSTEFVPFLGTVDLAVTKTDGQTTLESGSTTTYTIVVTNNGPNATNVTITDPAVSTLSKTSVGACSVVSGSATCPALGAAPGQLSIANLEGSGVTVSSMASGSSISFTVSATVTGTIAPVVNTVTVSQSGGGVNETSTANNSATDSNGLALNFGHLPAAYTGMNLLPSGARTLTGATRLGTGVTTATDGINTPTYTFKATDDGVAPTPAVLWSTASGGSVDVTVICPSAPCYLNAWIDWNNDADFGDSGENPFGNVAVVNGTNTLTFPIPSGALLDGTTLYSRFRVSNAPMNSPGPSGQAFSGLNGLIGEIEDWRFIITNGVVTTPVTLGSFRTFRESGDQVLFRWSTATEMGNVGFNLYARTAEGNVRLNDRLIRSKVVDSLAVTEYAFRTETTADVFFIEDVSIANERRRHGPFAIERAYGNRLHDEKIDWAAVQQQHRRAGTLRRQAALARAKGPGAPSSVTLQLEVRTSGIQRVSYEALQAATSGATIDKLELTHRGVAVPYWASAKKLGPGSFIEFVGEALDTRYTDANVYTLRIGVNGPAATVREIDAPPSLVPNAPASYRETFVLGRQAAYAHYSPTGDGWYDTSMLTFKAPQSWTFPFQLEGLADTFSTTDVELVAYGVTGFPVDPDHHLIADVNGRRIAEESFEGLVTKRWSASLPGGTVQEDANLLRITLPGDTGADFDLVNFDSLEVSYQRLFRAREGRLTFTAAGADFRVTNLPGADVVVYRVDSTGTHRLRGVRVQPEGATFTATFAGSATPAKYWVSTVGALRAPALEIATLRSDLQRAAKYLIIAHPDFIAGIQPLVQAREQQGLTVNVVDVNDIYSALTYGNVDPLAIKDYIRYAARELGTRSVLLVGGDTYDYRNYLGGNSISFIPSLYAPAGSIVQLVPSDALYTDFDDNGVPDLAIGRFPVRTVAELDMVVAKTLAYAGKDYGRTAAFAADVRDGFLSFKTMSDGLAGTLPASWSREAINIDDVGVANARNQLLAAMNRGTALVTYTGHSGPREWTFSGLFNNASAAALTNAGRPFVVVQWGCWNTYYVDPVNTYLVQSLLFSGDRGAAAVLGASTLVDAGSEQLLGKLLTPRLTVPGKPIGQALQEAKAELAKTHPELRDVLLGWTLMGDPELVIEP